MSQGQPLVDPGREIMGDIVSCGGCGAKNRLPEGWRGVPKCGSCGRVLSVEPATVDATFVEVPIGPVRRRRTSWVGPLLVVGALALGVVGYNQRWFDVSFLKAALTSAQKDDAWIDVPADTAPQAKPAKPTDLITLDEVSAQLAAAQKPKTFEETHKPVKQSPGIVFAKKKPHSGSTLTIRTSTGSNYYVQLVTANTTNAIQGIYVIGGKPVTVEVPIGVYEITYATGNVWYGKGDLFGPDTDFYKADHSFDYHLDQDGSIPYYEIELIQQVGGNMATHKIDPSQFGK